MIQDSRHTIIVPLDGSDLAEHALSAALRVAPPMHAALLLLRVVPELPPEERVRQAASVESADAYLAPLADRVREAGLPVQVVTCAGNAWERIVENAITWHASLIVMGTHGRGAVDRLLHGSVADAVVRHSAIPVLLVPARAEHHATLDGDCVLVSVDGSGFAERALGVGAEIARELTAPLFILRATFWDPTPTNGLAPSMGAIDMMEQESKEYIERLVDEVRRAGIDARGRSMFSPAARAIVEMAEEANAALIVMATHGRGGLSRLTMGSVATEVVTHARRPVLLVRAQAAVNPMPIVAGPAVSIR